MDMTANSVSACEWYSFACGLKEGVTVGDPLVTGGLDHPMPFVF